MNIPMAYDVTPDHTNANATGVVVNSSQQLSEHLLLSEQEQQWAAEMAAEGIAHLPINWYRQTVKQAVWGSYGVINRIVSVLINFGINVGLGFAVLKGDDEVGVWSKPLVGSHPSSTYLYADFLITTFLLTFLTTILSTPGIRTAMKKGQTVPVEDKELASMTIYKCTPVRMLGTGTRALLLSIWAIVLVCLPALATFGVMCASGAMHSSGSTCSLEKNAYIWLKGLYAGILAWAIYPLVLLATLNVRTLPPLDLTFFVENQKERWEKEQREADPQPL